jgi:hypothetical protein
MAGFFSRFGSRTSDRSSTQFSERLTTRSIGSTAERFSSIYIVRRFLGVGRSSFRARHSYRALRGSEELLPPGCPRRRPAMGLLRQRLVEHHHLGHERLDVALVHQPEPPRDRGKILADIAGVVGLVIIPRKPVEGPVVIRFVAAIATNRATRAWSSLRRIRATLADWIITRRAFSCSPDDPAVTRSRRPAFTALLRSGSPSPSAASPQKGPPSTIRTTARRSSRSSARSSASDQRASRRRSRAWYNLQKQNR